jgi:hypothetical protein
MTYGMAGYIGFGKETDWGTPVTPGSFMEAMSESLATTIDRFDTRNIFNSYAEPDDTDGMRRHEGDLVIPGNPESMGILLNAALGSVATTTLLTVYKQHVFQVRPTDVSSLTPLQPYTLEIFRDVTSAQQYAGGVCKQLVLQAQPNQDLRLTSSWVAKGMLNKARVAQAAVLFPTTPGQPFTFDTCSISVGGVAVDKIEGFTLTINNQLETVAALNNSNVITRVNRTGPVMATLQGTLSFLDISEFQDFTNQTERAVAISFAKAASFQCVINVPRFVYTAFPLGQSGRGRITVSFEGKARVPVGSLSQLAITLKNNTGSY